MKKKVLSILLTSAVALSTCACGDNAQQTEGKSGSEVNAISSESVREPAENSSEVTESSEEEYVPTYPICEETITLTAQGAYTGGTYDWSDTIQFQELEKRLGIKIDTEGVYDTDAWASKKSLLFASDELPDLLLNTEMEMAEVNRYGKDGYLLDFSQYLDVMPNFVKYMEDYPEWASYITTENGEIFGITMLSTRSVYTLNNFQIINNQWLQNLGLNQPESLDDFYNVLKAFKEQDANLNGDPDDEIPLVMHTDSSYMRNILWGHGIYATSNNFIMQVDDNGQVYLADVTDNYREFLKYMNKLYSEELINVDMFTILQEECKALAEEGRAGAISDYGSLISKTAAEPDDWYFQVGFTGELNEDKIFVVKSRVSKKVAMVASAETDYPEEIAKLVDYYFTDEGIVAAANGYEGVSFDWSEVAPGAKLADHSNYSEGYATNNEYQFKKVVSGTMQFLQSNFGTLYGYLEGLSEEELMTEESVRDYNIWPAIIVAFQDSDLKVVNGYPPIVYTDVESTAREASATDIKNYCKAASAQFITGEEDINSDDAWNAYVKQIEDMGLETLLKIEQMAYDRNYGN